MHRPKKTTSNEERATRVGWWRPAMGGSAFAVSCSCLLVVVAVSTGCSKNDASERESAARPAASATRPASVEAPGAAEPSAPETDTSARPAFASPTASTSGRPPHPAIPARLGEPAPSQELLAASSFCWLGGHWVWTGNEYEWQPGVWIYEVPGHELVPAQWVWDGEYWIFQDAGWTASGETLISVRPTAVSGGSASAVPEPGAPTSEVDLYVAPSSYPVYLWTGAWIAPPIVYPDDRAPSDVDRYPVRARSAGPAPISSSQAAQPPSHVVVEFGADPSMPDEEPEEDEEVELIPGVLHGGKRGEQERRLLEEQREREAEEEEGVDSVYVPYYYQPGYYYRRYPPRRPPARPRPLPAPARPR